MRASAPQFLDGGLGFQVALPDDWRLLATESASGRWETPYGAQVAIAHVAQPMIADAALLDEYRHDLRLLAATGRGGLIECGVHPGFGFVGVTKRPVGGDLGFFGHALVPCADGHASLIVVARQKGAIDPREQAVRVALSAGAVGVVGPWSADPYDERFTGSPWWSRLLRGGRAPTLRCQSDDREYDGATPAHPLSRTRRALQTLVSCTRVVSPPTSPAAPVAHNQSGISCVLPLGYLPVSGGAMSDGQVYTRQTFDGRRNLITVCRHPEFPRSGHTVDEARRMLQQHLEWSKQRVLSAPTLRRGRIGAHDGILVHVNSVLAERPMTVVAFYTPWRDDALEISCMVEPDDRVRAEASLQRVVLTMRDSPAN